MKRGSLEKFSGLAVASMIVCAGPAQAQELQGEQGEQAGRAEEDASAASDSPDTGFFGEAELGLRYDSDVAVDALDITSRQSDEAMRLKLRVGYEAGVSDNTNLEVSYGFGQTWYEDFSAFDLQTHTAAALVSHRIGSAHAAISYRFIHARLDRAGLLDIQRVAPTLSGFVADGLYARAEVLYRDSNFLGRIDRDNQSLGGGLDLFLFLKGTKRYISAGYDYSNVDAVDPQFDYVGHTAKLGFVQKFGIGSGDGRLKLDWRYQSRNYQNITPSIGQERSDDRHRLRAEIEFPLAKWLSLSTRYVYSDYGSNLPTADYSQSLVDVSLATQF